MKRLILIATLTCIIISLARAQEEEKDSHKITLSAYVDGYYAGYTNELNPNRYQPFITVGARGNTVGVNVAQVGVNYEHEKVRSNVILHYGDIPGATWSSDFNTIQEANVGLKLGDGVWLDAGFFATHIGTESFLPKNNMLSSTAFKTYNEPFYQSGAKITYDKPEQWEFQFWVLNGYNSLVDNNSGKSLGLLANYAINDDASLTYTNIYGRESSDGRDPEQFRFYQNMYYNQVFNDKVYVTVGFDYGWQSNSSLQDREKPATMFAGVTTLRYQFTPEFSITGRAEIFNDPDGFIGGFFFSDVDPTGYELLGFTLGGEYRPMENAYLRAEFRRTSAAEGQEVFFNGEDSTRNRTELLITMGVALEKVLGF